MRSVISSLLFLLLAFPLSLSAQWSLSAKNRLSSQANTEIFLRYTGEEEVEKEFQINLSIRPEGQPNAYMQKELTLKTDRSKSFCLPVSLPPGGYDIDVDVWDKKPNTWQVLALEEPYQINRKRNNILLSDIYLSSSPDVDSSLKAPYLRKEFSLGGEFLHYFLELYAPDLNQVAVRAILYQQDQGQRKQENAAASFYVSLYQAEQKLETAGQPAMLFQDAINISELGEGEYLIHALVYKGDNLIGEEKTWFTLGGGVMDRVYQDLDASIRMMEYIAPVDRLEYLLSVPEDIAKRAEFQKTWKTLYDTNTEENMEAYFRRVFEAENRYATDQTSGWQTDMGRIYILYGTPREKEVEIAGVQHTRWTYAEWGLSFLFVKRNQGFVLVE
ncbi:MAG: GWxTD domain-containing protein [Bacteroidota bacterium]